jgi:predicted nucleic acid-binding protein
MKVSAALQGIQRLAFDTAPMIYFVEKHPVYFDRMLSVMKYVDSGQIRGGAATLALLEVLVQTLKIGSNTLADGYEDILVKSAGFTLNPLTTSIARRAADFRARYGLRTPDAVHVATAVHKKYDAFLTNDTTFKRVSEIAILIVDDLISDT